MSAMFVNICIPWLSLTSPPPLASQGPEGGCVTDAWSSCSAIDAIGTVQRFAFPVLVHCASASKNGHLDIVKWMLKSGFFSCKIHSASGVRDRFAMNKNRFPTVNGRG